jgi:carboxymethylenebutenolidase
MGQHTQITAVDGFTLGAWEATPDGAPNGAVVVIQEIFGVNSHIRQVTDGYAADGFYAIAPQIFDRVERNIELGYEAADLQQGIAIAFQKLDARLALQDLQAAIERASIHGRVGVVGYCFGGLMAWRAACGLDGVAAASCYYGGGIAAEADRKARCPVTMHFGERDAHIPLADVDKIRAAQPDAEIHVYPADHGFNCDQRASYDAGSAALARQRTLEFFARHLA